jgi:hypothetical protein
MALCFDSNRVDSRECNEDGDAVEAIDLTAVQRWQAKDCEEESLLEMSLRKQEKKLRCPLHRSATLYSLYTHGKCGVPLAEHHKNT